MKRMILLSLLVLTFAGLGARADVPTTMSYQGLLRESGGAIVPPGTYDLTFRIYNAPAGGTPLWEEAQTVEVSEGIFNVYLGSAVPLALPFDVPYYVGISIEGEAEQAPRTPLASSPYAFYAVGGPVSGISGGGMTGLIPQFVAQREIGNSVIEQYGSDLRVPPGQPLRGSGKEWGRDSLRLPARAKLWVNDPTNAIVGKIVEPNAAADDRAGVYGYRDRNVANPGAGYGYAQTNNGVTGANWWGDAYTFGVAGYCYNDDVRTGGVLGSDWAASVWGSLAYKDANSNSWGLYTPNNGYVGSVLQSGSLNTGAVTAGNVTAANVTASSVIVAEGAVDTRDLVDSENSTTSTSWVLIPGATYNTPVQGSDRVMNLYVKVSAKGQSGGETACICVRGFCYGTATTTDLSDYDLQATQLGVLHVRSSSYANYYLSLGPFSVKQGQSYRFVANYKTRNASYRAYVNDLVFELRDMKVDF